MTKDEWITSKEASTILTTNSDHYVSDAYVRRLGMGESPKLRNKPLDGRTKLYLKRDVEGYRVTKRHKKEKKHETTEATISQR